MPEISIIIPTYNSESTILETVASLQRQSFTDFELIVIDDGSQDRTVEIVKQIDEPRLQVHVYQNGGVAIARNRGIALAQGKFISFSDADDLWSSDKLASQIEALKQNPQAKVAYSWTNYIDHKGNHLFAGARFNYQDNVYPQLVQGNFLASGSNILIDRDVLELVPGFDPQLSYTADWDFYLRLAKNFEFAVVPKYQIFYRQSADSMSADVESLKQENLFVIKRLFQNEAAELDHLYRCSCSNLYLYCADNYRKKVEANERKNLVNAKGSFFEAILLHPQNLFKVKTQKLLIKLILLELSFSAPAKLLKQH